jgi:hypothetical protein
MRMIWRTLTTPPATRALVVNEAAVCAVVLIFSLAFGGVFPLAAAAQMTVTTDQQTYEVGDIVEITIHNAGPDPVEFYSYPAHSILHVETESCISGCVGLPVIWSFEVGETMVDVRDTGLEPDLPGHYRIALHCPGSIETTYDLLPAPIPTESVSWSRVKALYR